ncbi:MAG: tetratricopeptide repeat protein [Sedimentisphaerales bacterium]|nr:tetratricopeptide repeat protein [Sedimentisphaerales bacterium]
MDRARRIIITTVALWMIVATVGCESYQKRKEQARLRYERATAKAKVPLARDYFEEGRIEDARKILDNCLIADPTNSQANLLMGEIQMTQGRTGEAKICFENALETDQELHKAWAYLGSIAQEEKQSMRAIECYNKALELEPLNTEYVLAIAESHTLQGDYDLALSVLRAKIQMLPSEVRLRIAVADIKHRIGDMTGATAEYRQALVLDENNMEVVESLGYCYIAQDRWPEAAQMFERLVGNSSGARKTAHQQILAMCNMNAGQYGKAVGLYNDLSVEYRDDAQLWLQMGRAALGSNEPERAQSCAQRALTLHPNWEDAIALKGCAQYLNADYVGAINTFRSITSSAKLGGFAWLMMGRSYQQIGQLTQAQKAYEQAAKLTPNSKLVSMLVGNQGSMN